MCKLALRSWRMAGKVGCSLVGNVGEGCEASNQPMDRAGHKARQKCCRGVNWSIGLAAPPKLCLDVWGSQAQASTSKLTAPAIRVEVEAVQHRHCLRHCTFSRSLTARCKDTMGSGNFTDLGRRGLIGTFRSFIRPTYNTVVKKMV